MVVQINYYMRYDIYNLDEDLLYQAVKNLAIEEFVLF
jgi:hypothetical protein